MRRPEPLPAFPPTLSGPQSGPPFTRVDEVNGAVITVIHSLSANGQYTGVGSVQSELFRRFPNCLSFIQRIGLYPDNIPAIVEHRRLIQSVNSLLWAYATTHNVLTLCDLEDLLQTEFRDSARYLGPIYTLPVAQELCEVTTFHPRVCEAFSGGTVDTVYRITTERLFEELNQFVCQNRYRLPSSQARQINRWWESVFTQHMLRLFGEQDVPRNATELTFSRLGVYGIRIKQFAKLIESIVEMLRPENLSRAAKLMQELLDTEVRRAYEKFAETTVSEEAIARLRRQKPVKALRTLANNCVSLHNNLMEWAEQMHLSWPPGFLTNLLSFQKFLDGIATAGPFRSLLHLALVYSKSEGISVRELLPKVQQNVVINLADDEEEEVKAEPVDADAAECQFVIDRQGNLSDTDSSEKLSNAVERFNRFIESLTVGLKAALGSLEGPPLRGLPWKLLRQFEKNLLQDLHWREKTLLTVLADACDSDSDVAKPVYLFPKSFVNENSTPANGAATQAASAIQQDAAAESAANSAKDSVVAEADKTDTVNVQAVRNFVLRLTCLLERSLKAIVGLVARELKTAESTDLLNTVQCFLAESVVNSLEPPRLSYLFHPMDFSFLGSKQTNREAVTCGMLQSKFAQELVTQRSAVLGLLATCPPMLDPEQWTLWSYPGFLAQRWGELEEFMLDCSALEVCDKFNLIVLKLSSGGYLRLSANATSKTIEKAFLSWQQQQQQEGTTKSPSSLRGLCDALVGSAFAINRLSAEEAVTALASRLKNAADCQLWVQLVLDILLIVPLSLLGLLFGKVILPALDEAGLRDKNAWAADRRDFQAPSSSTSTTAGGSVGLLDLLFSETPAGGARHCRRQHLITAVGALGSQLGWPAWVDFYQRHRYVLTATAAPVDVALPKSLEPRVDNTTSTTEAKQTPSPSRETSPSREPMELPNAPSNEEETSIIQTGLTSSRREFVENLRRREYGRGVELDETANKLLQLYERRLSRSLAHLSQELYGQPGHFLLELIQNADDNTYADDRGSNNDGGSVPSIEFYLYTADDSTTTSATLFVRNNEAAGFSEADISALCDVGVSTKMAQRDQKTGRKGIGFKSVFSVTDGPEVHSAGFHVRFQRPHTSAEKDQQQLGSILVPEWINPLFAQTPVPRIASADGGGGGINLSPSSLEPAGPWKTVFRLPLSGSRPSSTATGVCEFARELICPHVMLFLRRLKNITFAYISSGHTDKQASIFDYRRLVKTSKRLFSPVGESSSYLELVTIEETCLASPNSEVLQPIPTVTNKHQWLVFTRQFWVDPDQLRRLGCHSKVTLKHTNISIGINLSDTSPPTEYPVYAFLPVRSAGFSFLLNADFDLTSSREDVDGTSVWNRWLVGQLPTVFENLLQAIAEASPSQLQSMAVADLSQHVLLGRILNCLPLGAGTGAGKKSASSGVTAAAVRGTPSSIFSGVGEQLRDRLSRVVWIPVKPTGTADAEAASFAAPRQVLFLQNSLFQSGKTASQTPSRPKLAQKAVTSATSPDNFLIRLLIERLGMLELDPTFLVEHPVDGCLAATDTDSTAAAAAESEDVSRIEHGLEKLLALGVQTVSAESLLELASILSPDELKRSGVLLALIGNIENSFRSYGDLHQSLLQVAVSNHTNRRRRCCLALRHLAIFPLTDGCLVSLSEIEAASAPAAAAADSSISLISQNRLLLPPPPLPPSSSSGSAENPSGDSEETYGAYVSLLSRLGPLVSPSSIYPSMSHETAALPQLFTEPTSRDGLGLAIASPEVVLRQWIVPRLASMAMAPSASVSPANDSDWFIAAAQFVVWCSTQLHAAHPSPLLLSATTKSDVSTSTLNDLTGLLQGLPTQFPLLVSNRVHSEPVTVVDTDAAEAIPSTAARLQPALSSLPEGVRSTPLFVQPFLLCQQQSDSAEEGSLDTEADLMRLCLSGEQASEATLVSSCYFCSGRTCLETLGLLSSAALAHWLEFFVQAGASTLQSLHRKQYRYGDSPAHLPDLPSDHVLMAPLMKVLGGAVEPGTSWIVEDTVCPGLDTLLLPWIERTADACSSSAVMATCSKLAGLLSSNWPNFERSKLALYHQHADENAFPGLLSASVQSRSRSYEFAAASWLVNLRVCEWLPIVQSRDVPAVRRRLEEMRAKDTLQGAASRPPPPPADSVPSSIEDLHLASSSKFDLARAAEPHLRSHIYAPTAFAPVGLGYLDSRSPELTALLRALCPVWQSSVVVGDAAASPPCVNFTEALGLRTRLDEAAFEHFMDFLATSCEGLFAPSFLTPSLLLMTYELLKQFATDHHAPAVVPHGSGVSESAAPRNKDWLRGLLAPPSSRTILVPCLLSARHSGKRPRGSGPALPERCPACLRLETHTTAAVAAAEPGSSLGGGPPRKRRHSASGRGDAVSAQQEGEEEEEGESAPRYHLVPASWTCWQRVRLPDFAPTELTQGETNDEDDDDAGDEEDPDFEESNPTPVLVIHGEGQQDDQRTLPPEDVSDERVPLCDTYGSEWKGFFCSTLKVPATSSVAEVLRLRPPPPSGTLSDASYRRAQKHFGQRLGAWYSLLQFCIASENLTFAEIEASLFNVPLLYDLSGRWRTRNSGRLFAWSTPDLAGLFIRAAPAGSDQLLGHSLPALDASASSPIQVRIGSAPGFRNPGTLVGTTNAFLLDVLRLPLLDQVASLGVGLFEVPSQAGMIPGFAVPCAPLDAVLKAFRQLAQAWLAAPTRSTSLKPSSFLKTMPPDRVEAYFVPDLTLTLTINMPGQSEGGSDRWTIPNIACRLVNDKLYMDSCFGEHVFADFVAAPENCARAAASPLARLHSALTKIDTATNEGGVRVESIQQMLLAELARALLPTNRSSQLALIHFVRGFLNVTTSLLEQPSRPDGRRQLHAYMLSHGIPRSQANHLLNSLLPSGAPQPSSSSSSVQRPAPPIVETAASLPTVAPTTPVVNAGGAAGAAFVAPQTVEPTSQPNLPVPRSIRVSQLTAATRGTRYQTLLSEAFSSGASKSQSRSTTEEAEGTTASSETFWRGITDASDSSALSAFTREKLSRALSSGGSSASAAEIGRMGEMAVFQYLQQAIRHSRQDAQLTFPSGHPNLGPGRLVDCRWVNADSESRLPYDITVTLEVECSQDRWHPLLNSLTQEVARRYVTVSRTPSHDSPGLLTVGPLYLEVKSTVALDDQSSRLDIFEFSLSEAVFAHDNGWRYHLVRVHWSRRQEASAPVPVLTHVPNLSDTLFAASGLRMCLAMAMPQQATTTSD